jgi:hypothetical protein
MKKYFIITRDAITGALNARKASHADYLEARIRGKFLKRQGLARMRSVCAGNAQAIVLY